MKDTTGKTITEHEFTKDIGHRTESKTIEEMFEDISYIGMVDTHEADIKSKELREKITKQIQSDLLKEVLKPEKLIDGKTYGLEWLRGFNYALEKYRDRIKKLAEEKRSYFLKK